MTPPPTVLTATRPASGRETSPSSGGYICLWSLMTFPRRKLRPNSGIFVRDRHSLVHLIHHLTEDGDRLDPKNKAHHREHSADCETHRYLTCRRLVECRRG